MLHRVWKDGPKPFGFDRLANLCRNRSPEPLIKVERGEKDGDGISGGSSFFRRDRRPKQPPRYTMRRKSIDAAYPLALFPRLCRFSSVGRAAVL